MATFYDCFQYSPLASQKYFLPEDVHGVWVIRLPGWGIPGAFNLARNKAKEDGCLIAIEVYGVLVLVGPKSDSELLLRDVLELQPYPDAIVGPTSAIELDAELTDLVRQYVEAQNVGSDSEEKIEESEQLVQALESQIRRRLADVNESLGNPVVNTL